MSRRSKTEEELKNDIFNTFSQLCNEPVSDRRQVYFTRFCELVWEWCTDFIFTKTDIKGERQKKARKMGVEIYNVMRYVAHEKGNADVPKEKNIFLGYLKSALYKAKAAYYRDPYNESDTLKSPRICIDMNKLITEKESYAGRELSEGEKIHLIAQWFGKPEKSAKKYLEMINRENTGSLWKDDEVIDVPTSPSHPLDNYFSALDCQYIRQAFEDALAKRQEKTRECNRALFTARCIEKAPNHLKGLTSVLDTEILNEYNKTGTVPNLYKVYSKYHPDRKQESAAVSASVALGKLLEDMKTYLEMEEDIRHVKGRGFILEMQREGS